MSSSNADTASETVANLLGYECFLTDPWEVPVKLMAAVLVVALFGWQDAKRGTEKRTASSYRAESSAYVIK
jgi:hypothetical protein